MKKIVTIFLCFLIPVITFMAGVFVTLPKQVINHDLESKFTVLDGYRKWVKFEVQLEPAPIEQGLGVLCEDGSLPTYKLYSGFGNALYTQFITFIGGSFDGYFYSTRVVECGDHYFINENGNGGKYFGPFFFNKQYSY